MLYSFLKKTILTVLLGLSFNFCYLKSEFFVAGGAAIVLHQLLTGAGITAVFGTISFFANRSSNESESESSIGKNISDNSKIVSNELLKKLEILSKAAKDGDIKAQNVLQYLHLISKEIEKNPDAVFESFYKAAEEGFAEAQFYLGLCCENGWGIEKSKEKAFEWYERSAEQGFDKAQEKLESLVAKEIAYRNSAEAPEKIDQEARRYVNRENRRTVVEIVY